MGGGHHDFGERMKIPDYRIYKVEDAPDLERVRKVLEKKGLKDPWLRNEVWRYSEKEWSTPKHRLQTFFFRGFKVGFAAFLATIAVETAINVISKKEDGSSHH